MQVTDQFRNTNLSNNDDKYTDFYNDNKDEIYLEGTVTSADFLRKLINSNITQENVIDKVFELKAQYPSGEFLKIFFLI